MDSCDTCAALVEGPRNLAAITTVVDFLRSKRR